MFFFYRLSSLISDWVQFFSFRTKMHRLTHQTTLETGWTLFPVFVILLIAIPSFVLLYAIDVMVDSSIIIKAIGKQWYWNYEIEFPFLNIFDMELDFKRRIYDSYIVSKDDLIEGQLRNLEVDQPLVVPVKTHLDVVVTADDVLHSFSIPSLGIKVDAVPGRLNHMGVFVERSGVFYGQCSELCGTNHGFMPIKALGLSYNNYIYFNERGVTSKV